MRRHDETWQFFSDKCNKIEIEREGTEAKLLRPIFLGSTAVVSAMKYCGINFLRKELCREKKSVPFWTLIYVHIYSVILLLFKSAPLNFKYTPSMRQNFTMRIVRDEYKKLLKYIS